MTWLKNILSACLTGALTFVKGWPVYVWGAIALFFFGFVFGGCVCNKVHHVIGEDEPVKSFGWVDKPDHVAAVVKTFAKPYFGDVAKVLIQKAEDKDALLYLAYRDVNGVPWRAHDQDGVGCCCGEGWSGGQELLSCVDIKVRNEPEQYKSISASAVYALSRELGGMLGNQDGSTGADCAKAAMTLGNVSCEEAKDDNTSGKPHGQVAKEWGRTGLPSHLKEIAAKHRIKTASLVRTPEEARTALINGYPVVVCSSVGFEGNGGFKRDKDGFCYPGKTWAHCMFCSGYRADRKAFCIMQSWGESLPPGPTSLDQPSCSFWITWAAMQRIINAGESYAISGFDGYPAQDVNFFVERRPDAGRSIAVFNARRFPDFSLAY